VRIVIYKLCQFAQIPVEVQDSVMSNHSRFILGKMCEIPQTGLCYGFDFFSFAFFACFEGFKIQKKTTVIQPSAFSISLMLKQHGMARR
jgi:hypothetical protein